MLCRSPPPPGLWKCHAVSVAMQMVTLECCKSEEGGGGGQKQQGEEKKMVLWFKYRKYHRHVQISNTSIDRQYNHSHYVMGCRSEVTPECE